MACPDFYVSQADIRNPLRYLLDLVKKCTIFIIFFVQNVEFSIFYHFFAFLPSFSGFGYSIIYFMKFN